MLLSGYYGIGVYAILCNLSVTGIIFPQLASFWIRAAANIEEAKLQEKLLQAVPRSSYHKTRNASLLVGSTMGSAGQGNTFDHSNNSKTNVITTSSTFDRSNNSEKEKEKKSKRGNTRRGSADGSTKNTTNAPITAPLTGVTMGYNQPTTGVVDTMSNLAASVAAISAARVTSSNTATTTATSTSNNNGLNESKV